MFIDSSLPVPQLRRIILNVKWRSKTLFIGVHTLEPYDGMKVATFGEVMQLDAFWGRWVSVPED